MLANRLSADGKHSVLLLEAGPKDSNLWIHVPLGYGKLFKEKTVNWMYQTEPEPGLNGRQVFQPRGKVLGGSSSINGLLYVRGQHEDYDRWRQHGNTGWGFDDVLPYFKKAEDQQRGADEFHGAGGPLPVSDMLHADPLSGAFIKAAVEAGIPDNPDFNGATQEGAGWFQTTTRNGRRASTAKSYLRPAKGRRNLHVETSALAQRILFEGRRATGIEYRQNGALRTARARKEILISSGAYNSPQLLQLSGVGPAELLKSHGIDVVLDAPGVGNDLQDHMQVRIVMRCSQPITLNDVLNHRGRSFMAGARYAAFRKGPLTIAAGTSGAFFKTDPRLASPDVQIHFLPFSTDKMGEKLHPYSAFSASVCQVRPESRGSLRIKSADPMAAPEIRINYLATETDRTVNVEGLKILRRILAAPALKPFTCRGGRSGCEGCERRGSVGVLPEARQHGLSSDLDLPDGQRSARGGGPAASASRHRWPARGRRLDHAGPRLGQYQRACHHDRGKSLRHDTGGCAVSCGLRRRRIAFRRRLALCSGRNWPLNRARRRLEHSGGNSDADRHAQERHGTGPDRGNCPAPDRGHARHRCRDRQVRNPGRPGPDQQAVGAWRQGRRLRCRDPQERLLPANCRPRCIRSRTCRAMKTRRGW